MERRRIDYEHSETRTCENAGKVPFVGDDSFAKGIIESCFHSEHYSVCELDIIKTIISETYIEALCDKDGEMDCPYICNISDTGLKFILEANNLPINWACAGGPT